MTEASASAKLILFGEHAVVYGRPAIAIPLPGLRAYAIIAALPGEPPGRVRLSSAGVEPPRWLRECPPGDPLAAITRLTLEALDYQPPTALSLDIRSDIPIAAGLGSGAAVSVAAARALALHAGRELGPQAASDLAFQVERIHHGSPSGIDNTVIAFDKPIFFVRGEAPRVFEPGAALQLVLGDTGVRVKTSAAVSGVRERRKADPQGYEQLFDRIGDVTQHAFQALQSGQVEALGAMLVRNHELLQALGVSCAELDRLVEAAMGAGASGAKLSGAGQGGFMLALVEQTTNTAVQAALQEAGAAAVFKVEAGR